MALTADAKCTTHQNGGDVGAVLVEATGARIYLKGVGSENVRPKVS